MTNRKAHVNITNVVWSDHQGMLTLQMKRQKKLLTNNKQQVIISELLKRPREKRVQKTFKK